MTQNSPRRKRVLRRVLGSKVAYRTDAMMAVLVDAGRRRWDNRWHYLPWAQRAVFALALALVLSQAQNGFGNPVGGNVTAGKATITTTGTTLTVDQQTKIVIIDWSKFEISKGETTQFLQPGATALAVNRIGGNDPSKILGSLLANGRIILINGNGILFGPDAKVDVGALIATTSDADNADILSGKATFDKAGSPNAMVVNQGAINAKTGMIGLIAPAVRNDGVIVARLGNVTLGASNIFTVDFTGDGLISFPLDANVVAKAIDANGKPVEALVVNNGRIEGATVLLTARAAKDLVRNVISTGGKIAANTVTVNGDKIVLSGDDTDAAATTTGGTVTLDGGTGGVLVTGGIDVSGTAGGAITVQGGSITLAGAALNASGTTGGGAIRIGGEAAQSVSVDAASVLSTSAITNGDAGSIYVMSQATQFAGRAEAKGGAQGGNGGEIETSGHTLDIAGASIDTSAVSGRAGTWLLDPDDYTIDAAQATTIQSNLANGNVTIQTTLAGSGGNGDIFVNASISWASGNGLTLSAYRNIAVNANITGTGTVTLYADNTGTGTGTVNFVAGTSVSTSGAVTITYNPTGDNTSVNATKYTTATQTDYSPFITGGGSLTTYMLVNNITDLQNIQNNLSGTYALGRDIDASITATWNGGEGFKPIGTYSGILSDPTGSFTGTFDGDDHTIINLTISRPTTDNIGLFGVLGTGGMVLNVGLLGGDIAGGQGVGGLVGFNMNGAIAHAYTTGSVTGTTAVGGLVGGNYGGSIIDSHATGTVSGEDTVGGLAGWTNSTITRSYATGMVNSIGSWVGGLAGAQWGGTITQSYATGNVSGLGSEVGGLVGGNFADIHQSYATGAVNGIGGGIGGLVGTNFGFVSQSYATGYVSGDGTVGGLLGNNEFGGIQNSYWDTQTTNQNIGVGSGNSAGATGLTTAQARTQSSYAGWDFAGTWFMIDGETRPFLRSEYSTTITNGHQLQLMAMNLSATYTLANDIDLGPALNNPSEMWGSAGFVPVGTDPSRFEGSFDGGEYSIGNLTINRPSMAFVGLFGVVGTNGDVQNVRLTDVSVIGATYVGAVAGANHGVVATAYADGMVQGDAVIGGLIGSNYLGRIEQSSAAVAVTGTDVVGGLVGDNWNATVVESYATGNVVSAIGDHIGGLAGNNTGSITGSYATGSVSGGDEMSGGLVGYNGGTIAQSYATGIVSGYKYVGGLAGWNGATITQSYATGAVSGAWAVGGLAGESWNASISQSHATGAVTSTNGYYTGGLVGINDNAEIANAYATGSVTGGNWVGGLAGENSGTVIVSYATGAVGGTGAYVGGLAGSSGGTIEQSYAAGSVAGGEDVGGLVGYSSGTIISSHASGSVSGSNMVGGVVGWNNGTVTQSYATGAVEGTNYYIGGLVGWNTGTATQNYATGTVDGYEEVGGLVGMNSGAVSQSYAVGTVNGAHQVGGLVGLNYIGGTVTQSYASGAVSGIYGVGGLMGLNEGAVAQSYWDTETTGQNVGIGGGEAGGVTGLTSAQARTQSSYAGWDFAGTWFMIDGETRPFLRSEYSTTITNAHQLQLMAMNLSASYTLANNIDLGPALAADANGNYSGMWGAAGFVPIGGATDSRGNVITFFAGTFDGQGHTISDLTIYRPGNNYVGLFGYAWSTGAVQTIKDVGLIGGSVYGNFAVGELIGLNASADISNSYTTGAVNGGYSVGGLVGRNNCCTISKSYTTGAVSGGHVGGLVGDNAGVIAQSYATGPVNGGVGGGLVGHNSGLITESHATGAVSGGSYVGGLIGYNRDAGTISQSYATGAVNGGGEAGGLVGYVDHGTITQSYATGAVSATNNLGGLVGYSVAGTITASYATGAVGGVNGVGGLVGYNTGSVITESYWDIQSSGQNTGIGVGDATGATGLMTAQFTDGTLPAGFDRNVWGAKAGSYPCLLWQFGCAAAPIPPTTAVTYLVDDASSTYGTLANIPVTLTGVAAGDTANVSPVLTAFDAVNAGYSIVDSLNAGTYTVKVTSLTGSAAPNYTIAATGNHDGTLTVNPAPLIAAVNSASRIYGDANPAFTADITGFVLGQNASVLTDFFLVTGATNLSNVGNYAITAAGVSGNYYLASVTDGTLTITPRPITVTAGSTSRTYGDANPDLTYSVTSGTLVNGDTLSGTLATSAVANSNVGGYAITQGTLAATPNYQMSFQDGLLNVLQRAITLTADNLSRLYGDANPDLTYSISSGNLVNGDTLTGSLATSAVAASGIGNYQIGQGSLTASSNYALNYQSGTLIITPRPVAVTADSASRLYGDSNPVLTYSVSSGTLVNGDAFSGYLTTMAEVTSNVGSYDIDQGTLGLSSNYVLSFSPGTLTINPAPITIAVNDAARAYGDANPAFSANILGLKLGQDAGVLTGLTFSTAATQTSGVGSYAITSSGGSASNYVITARTDGTLSVTARSITVTAGNVAKVYGAANPYLSYTVAPGGLVNGDKLTGALSTAATAASNVGFYAITQGTLAATPNYALNFVPGTLTVYARPITIVADNATRVYGNANPALTYSITAGNLVNGDTLIGILATSAVAASNVGNYAINQGTLTAGSNYAINFQPGTLIITPRAITVTADNTSRIYGDGNPALTYNVTAGNLVSGDSFAGALATSAVATSNIGNYAISQGTLTAGSNYALTFQAGTIAITPRAITITANNTSRSYGDVNPTLTYAVTSGMLVNGDSMTGALATSAVQTSNVATYAITQGSLAASSNYQVSFQGGTLTITPAALTVTVNNASRMFGYANPDFSATITGFKLSDDASAVSGLIFVTDATRTSPVGTYAIKSYGGTTTNYVIVSRVDGTLTIDPLPIATTDQIATIVNYLNDLPTGKGGVVVLSSTDPNVIANFKKITGSDAANDNAVSCLIAGGPQCKQ